MHSEKHLIILTATVFPQVQQDLIRKDPNLRLSDYLKSIEKIEKQIRKCNADILVLENSDSLKTILNELSKRRIDTRRISFLSCPIDKSSSVLGISSGEHSMLREAARRFDFNSYDVVWKLTGRLSVDNLKSILNNSTGDFRANTFFRQHHSVDSRFFGMSTTLFVKFANDIPNYYKGPSSDLGQQYGEHFKSIEYFLAYFTLRAETEGFTFKSLPFLPVYSGVSGSTGKSLDNFRARLITTALNKVRKFLIKGLLGVNP